MDFHPLADLFPLMTDPELDALADDIRAHGLQHPIWLASDGRIIDGRNRWIACARAHVTPDTRTWTDDTALLAFVISQNLQRRHLSTSQRALVAARLANLEAGERADRPYGQSVTVAVAAQLLNVGARSVRRARGLLRLAPAAVIAAVEDGTATVYTSRTNLLALPAPPPALPVKLTRSIPAAAFRRARITELAARGHTAAQIADAIHLDRRTVLQILRRYAIDCPAERVMSRTREPDATRIMEHVVITAAELTADEHLIDFRRIDIGRLQDWIASLTASQKALGGFIVRLKHRLGGLHVETEAAASHIEVASGPAGADQSAARRRDAATIPPIAGGSHLR